MALRRSPVREADVRPGYVLHGQEIFLAERFLAELRETLLPGGGEDLGAVETRRLEETSWAEILDLARTASLLFTPWRLVIVRVPEPSEGEAAGKAPAGGRGRRALSAADEKALKAYFADPPARTVLAVIAPTDRRGLALVRFLSSLEGVEAREFRPLKDAAALAWLSQRADAMGKRLSPAAAARLLEVSGSDLRRLDNELAKLAVHAGAAPAIEAADVDAVTAWTRPSGDFEMEDALERGDVGRAVATLNAMFKDGERPEVVVGQLGAFFRKVFAIKAALREGRPEPEAFRAAYPNILESFGDLYRRKFRAALGLARGLGWDDWKRLLGGLARIDLQIKTADPSSPQAWFEAFLVEYGRMREARGLTSPARRP